MIGAIIGAGLSAVGSIFGGMKASQAAKKREQALRQEQAKNRDWYNRRYYEDATQRADAQRVLSMTEDSIKRRNRAAAGTAAVMGTATEAAAAEKEANNKIMADAVSQINAAAEARKDNIEAQYRQRDAELEGQLIGIQAEKAANIGQAISGVASAAGSIASSLGSDAKTASANKAPELKMSADASSLKAPEVSGVDFGAAVNAIGNSEWDKVKKKL